MSEASEVVSTSQTGRERGRFVSGNNGGGRPIGSRNKLGEAFLADLRETWEAHAKQALEKCATEDPVALCAGFTTGTSGATL
jgi:hypothetical protein